MTPVQGGEPPSDQPATGRKKSRWGRPRERRRSRARHRVHRNDAVFYLAAAVVGAIVGLLGSLLHFGVARLLAWPEMLRSNVNLSVEGYVILTGVIAAVMVTASVWLVRQFAPEAAGSGIQEVEGAMGGLRQVHWRRVLVVKYVGSFFSLGSGMVLGREGPTIHIGAAISQAFSEWLSLSERDARGLLGSGAAAGLAAAFGAPLASILFVIEETRREFPYSLKTYTALMLAAATSGIVTAAIAGLRPFMDLDVFDVPVVWLPAFVILGMLLGALGVAFNTCLVWSLDASLAIGRRTSFYLVPAVVGFSTGAFLVVRPEATMGGDNLALRLIEQNVPLTIMAVILVVRFIMTMASYSTGAPGGIFAPILSLATVAGLVFTYVLSTFLHLPSGLSAAFAVAAMGGLFSSTVRAPLVGIVLTLELTGAYSILIPTILTCLFANLFAALLGGRPIYEVLLERTLALAGRAVTKAETYEAERPTQIGGWDQRS